MEPILPCKRCGSDVVLPDDGLRVTCPACGTRHVVFWEWSEDEKTWVRSEWRALDLAVDENPSC
jgi:DNA-directed RNA polymerase subunit RPC12/RpoP